jgi:hypothetical protein
VWTEFYEKSDSEFSYFQISTHELPTPVLSTKVLVAQTLPPPAKKPKPIALPFKRISYLQQSACA